MKPIKTDEYSYIIPSWAAHAMNGGEIDTLSEDDIETLEAFVNSLPRNNKDQVGTFDYGNDEPDFRYYNDVDKFGSNCYEATYTVFFYSE